MKKIRYGVVGLGHRGRAMGKLAAVFDCAEFAAACDIRPSNWYEQQWLSDAALADMFPNTVFYEDYDTMLQEANLDAVIVETGADIHVDFCIKALERNIHVLSDIPTVASLEEAERLWKAAEKSKAIISVGANPNEQRFSAAMMERSQQIAIGAVQSNTQAILT